MMNHADVFNYFESKSQELSDKYGFGRLETNPCSIKSKEDLTFFTQRMVDTLFSKEEFYFLENSETIHTTVEKVNFSFNGEKISLKIDPKFGHIEVDFFKTIKYLAGLSGKMISSINPTGDIVAGNEEDMKLAWNKGFPIHLDEVDFLHKNLNGKRFKMDEVKSKFHLNQVVDINSYEEIILKGLNIYLAEKQKTIRYHNNQIRAYIDYRKSICVSLNGDYNGSFKIIDNATVFDNNFVNHIFLLNYWSIDSGKTLMHTFENGDKIKVVAPFKDYISTLGSEN